jgi:hypothetical protein
LIDFLLQLHNLLTAAIATRTDDEIYEAGGRFPKIFWEIPFGSWLYRIATISPTNMYNIQQKVSDQVNALPKSFLSLRLSSTGNASEHMPKQKKDIPK